MLKKDINNLKNMNDSLETTSFGIVDSGKKHQLKAKTIATFFGHRIDFEMITHSIFPSF